MRAKIGTASTKAANRRWSWATAQIATRLPKMGNVRYSTSAYGVALALVSAAAASRGVASTAATGARYVARYSLWLTKTVAIHTTAMNIAMPATGPTRISSL